jgi:phosphatidate cytidylyltransferase
MTPTRPGIVLFVALLVIAPLAGEEIRRMSAPGPARPDAISVVIAVLLATLPSCLPVILPSQLEATPLGKFGWLALGWAAALAWAFALEMVRFQPNSHAMDRIQRTAFIALYVGLLGFMAQLRFIGDNTWGLIALLSLVVTVKMSDSFAYLVGRTYGRRKLTPTLSPGKTVEGALAAVVFGILGSLLVLYPIAYWLTGHVAVSSFWQAVAFGLFVSIVGIWGDLVESLIKRESQCKDSGALIPGMGGVLDVMDSIIGAAPLVFFLWAIGLATPVMG